MLKPETSHYLLYDVPNDTEGKKFIAQVKKYLNKSQYTLTSRARGARTLPARNKGLGDRAFDQSLPQALGTSFVVYAIPKKKDQDQETNRRIDTLEKWVRELNQEKYDLLNKLEAIKREVNK
tara:strand:- start:184 stop:549 length:366 start_codon:yes stop_codon:yes gene_type:complete